MDNRKIDLLAIGIIIVLISITYFTVIKGGMARAAVLKDEVKMHEQELSSVSEVSLELDRIEDDIKTMQKNLENFDRQLPDDKRIYEVLNDIDRLAKENSVDLQAVTPGKLEKGELYSRIPITISSNADIKSFYRFLHELESIPRITRTERLQIDSLPHEAKCEIEMDLAVFVGGN